MTQYEPASNTVITENITIKPRDQHNSLSLSDRFVATLVTILNYVSNLLNALPEFMTLFDGQQTIVSVIAFYFDFNAVVNDRARAHEIFMVFLKDEFMWLKVLCFAISFSFHTCSSCYRTI